MSMPLVTNFNGQDDPSKVASPKIGIAHNGDDQSTSADTIMHGSSIDDNNNNDNSGPSGASTDLNSVDIAGDAGGSPAATNGSVASPTSSADISRSPDVPRPVPSQAMPTAGAASFASPASRINKNDAKMYLDQVRIQFADQPEIYSRFLDIMKEFKAHTITTESVIERVTVLFRGFPHMIEGFNAFIPEEHRIKVSPARLVTNSTIPIHPHHQMYQNAPASNANTATPSDGQYHLPSTPNTKGHFHHLPTTSLPHHAYAPTGIASSTRTPHPAYYSNIASSFHHPIHPPLSMLQQPPSSVSKATNTPTGTKFSTPWTDTMAMLSPNTVPNAGALSYGHPPPPPQMLQSHVVHPHSTGAITDASGQPHRKASMGMIQAVGYLRKIQDRFYSQPEVYQSFVDILRSYQREQKTIREVYTQVSLLFTGHPDLLEEFTQFIPDAQNLGLAPRTPVAAAAGSMPAPATSTASTTAHAASLSTNFKKSTQQRVTTNKQMMKSPHQHLPTYQTPPPSHPQMSITSSRRHHQDIDFFDKVKLHLNNNDTTYGEFIKCIDFYTHHIIDKGDLIKLVHGFICRSSSLYSQFLVLLGEKGAMDTNKTPSHVKDDHDSLIIHPSNAPDAFSLDLTRCKRLGSYRFLPSNYVYATCSGRTSLCNQVLNDRLVSCPSFNSEDSTFVTSKKNSYEEALFRCEDERYELDLLIETNASTILALYAFQLSVPKNRTSEESDSKDCDGDKDGKIFASGTTSRTPLLSVIHQNLLKKVYGSRGDLVLQAIYAEPDLAIPVVIQRLSIKDEEWRAAQRDWDIRVWKDVHMRNYYKALDYQGITFKSTDKKTLSVKALANELYTLYLEDMKRDKKSSTSTMATITCDSSLSLLPSSQGLSYLRPGARKREQVKERKDEDPRSRDIELSITRGAEPGSCVNAAGNDKSSIESSSSSIGKRLYSVACCESIDLPPCLLDVVIDDVKIFDTLIYLCKRVLILSSSFNDIERSSIRQFISHFIPDFFSNKEEELKNFENLKRISNKTNQDVNRDSSCHPKERLFATIYANESMFAFFRILQIAYCRLKQIAILEEEKRSLNGEDHKNIIIDRANDLPASGRGNDASLDEAAAWPYHLSLVCTSLIDYIQSNIDQTVYEEKLRVRYGPSAYVMFTYDRVIVSLLKQIGAVLSDHTSEHLVALYDTFVRPSSVKTPMSEFSYKQAARALIKGEKMGDDQRPPATTTSPLFRIEALPLRCATHRDNTNQLGWLLRFHLIPLQISGPCDMNNNRNGVLPNNCGNTSEGESLPMPLDKWSTYVDEFVDAHYDHRVLLRKPPLMLIRCLKSRDNNVNRNNDTNGSDTKTIFVDYRLECKISVTNFKMYFVANTEDFIYKKKCTKKKRHR